MASRKPKTAPMVKAALQDVMDATIGDRDSSGKLIGKRALSPEEGGQANRGMTNPKNRGKPTPEDNRRGQATATAIRTRANDAVFRTSRAQLREMLTDPQIAPKAVKKAIIFLESVSSIPYTCEECGHAVESELIKKDPRIIRNAIEGANSTLEWYLGRSEVRMKYEVDSHEFFRKAFNAAHATWGTDRLEEFSKALAGEFGLSID